MNSTESHHTATGTKTVAFWVPAAAGQPAVEAARSTVACPTRGCKNQCHPVRVVYQDGTGAPAVRWECGRHNFFSCSVQDWYPLRHMRLAG